MKSKAIIDLGEVSTISSYDLVYYILRQHTLISIVHVLQIYM